MKQSKGEGTFDFQNFFETNEKGGWNQIFILGTTTRRRCIDYEDKRVTNTITYYKAKTFGKTRKKKVLEYKWPKEMQNFLQKYLLFIIFDQSISVYSSWIA